MESRVENRRSDDSLPVGCVTGIRLSEGLIGDPCGVPRPSSRLRVLRCFFPRSSVSSTGASSHILIRCSMAPSTIRRATDFIRVERTSSRAGGVYAGCYQPLLPAGPSRRYLCESFPGCLDPCHGGTWSACACFFLHVIGLPPYTIEVGFPAFARQNDFLTDLFFETAVISLCSGPQVAHPPDRSHRSGSSPLGGRGFCRS
jgi:hypothetical protein